jgi:hypothetical protein
MQPIQLPGETAVVIYAPVYRGEGRGDLVNVGYVVMSFRYHALIAAAFANQLTPPFGFTIHDAEDAERRLLFNAGADLDARVRRSVDFAGRTLIMSFTVTPPQVPARASAAIAVALTMAG